MTKRTFNKYNDLFYFSTHKEVCNNNNLNAAYLNEYNYNYFQTQTLHATMN